MQKPSFIFRMLIVLSFFSLSSCQEEKEYEARLVNNTYSIEIPLMLTQATSLHDEASLQYQNLQQELYVLAIEEPKNEIHDMIHQEEALTNFTPDFEGYAKLITENMDLRVRLDHVSELKDTIINGHKAKLQTMESEIDGNKAYYWIGIFEGDKNYYQVITWTLLAKKELHQSKMEHMIYSFKEIQ
jgi:hypothetical protein